MAKPADNSYKTTEMESIMASKMKKNLLYVDDEQVNLTNLKMALDKEYNIVTASSGAKALALFESKGSFDIVIADQRMPKMSGVELLEKIYQLDPEPIRIILTAYTDVDDIVGAINRGHVYNYILKPWDEKSLKITLERAVESHELVRDKKALLEKLAKKNEDLTKTNAELKMVNKRLQEEIIQHKNTAEDLASRTQELEEAHIATKVLLKQGNEAKRELEERVLANIKELVMPYLEELHVRLLDRREQIYTNVVKTNIEQITSAFSQNLSSKSLGLTPREIQVADLVRQGRTNKEMADLLNLSSRTVEFYRDNLRKKFGLKNMKVNLRSFLLSMP